MNKVIQFFDSAINQNKDNEVEEVSPVKKTPRSKFGSMETELTFDHAGIKKMMTDQPTYEGATLSGSAIDMEDDDAKRKLTLYYASKLGVDPAKMNYESAVEAYKGKKYLDTKPAELFRVTRNEIKPVPDDNFTKLQEFNKMTAEEQWEIVKGEDDKSSYDASTWEGMKNFWGGKTQDELNNQYTPEEKSALIDKYRGELFIGSEYAVKAQGEKVLSDRAKKYAVDISLGMEVPVHTFTAFSPKEQAILFPFVRALNPEVDGGTITKSWARLTQTFGDRAEGIGRTIENRKRIHNSDVKLYQTMKDHIEDYDTNTGQWSNSGSKAKAQEWLSDKILKEAITRGGMGLYMPSGIDVESDDFKEMMARGKQEDMEFAIRRRISNASRKLYKTNNLFEEVVVEGVSMGADLGATIALSSVPIVGQGLAMGYTSSVFYGDFVDTLVYDHNVSLDDAQSIAGVATIPYALAEMGQAKVLKSAMSATERKTAKEMLKEAMNFLKGELPKKAVKETAENKGRKGILGYAQRRVTDYAKEVGQESFQAGVELVGKAYAKEFADAKGIEYTDLVQDWWDETIMAMKALVLPTGVGGSIGDYRRMKGGAFGSIEHAQNIAKQVADTDILPPKDLDVVDKLSDEARAFYTEAQTVEERQEVLDLYAPELTIEQVEQALDREMIVEQLTEDAVADLKQSTGMSEQQAQEIVENDLDTFVQSRAKATKYAKTIDPYADIEQTGADTFTIKGKNGADINLNLVDKVLNKAGEEVGGQWQAGDKTITLPRSAEDFTFTHEITHAMRDLGLISDKEWEQVVKYGKKQLKSDKVKTRFQSEEQLKETYGDLVADKEALDHEIVANTLEDWRRNGEPEDASGAFQRILNFFKNLIGKASDFQVAKDIYEGKPLQGEAQQTSGGDVRYSVAEKLQAINAMDMFTDEIDFDKKVSSDASIDIEALNERLDIELDTVSHKDMYGIPMSFTISDTLASGSVLNEYTGENIDLHGGLGFTGLEQFKDMAWANTDEKTAQATIDKSMMIYEANKALFEKLWRDGKLPYGHIPMAVVKMGDDAVKSNEALFRAGVQNIGAIPIEYRKKAFTATKIKLEEEISKRKKGLSKSKNIASAKKILNQYEGVLKVLNQTKSKDLKTFLENIIKSDLPLPAKAVASSFVFRGQAGKVPTKFSKVANNKENSIAYELVGGRDKDQDLQYAPLFNLGVISEIVKEQSMANVPQRHIIGYSSVDVKNGGIEKISHPNYPYGVKGQWLGVDENPIHIQDFFSETHANMIGTAMHKMEATGEQVSEDALTSWSMPVQSGLSNSIFTNIKPKEKSDYNLLNSFMNIAFPKVNFFTDPSSWEEITSSEDTKLFSKDGDVIYGVTSNGDVYLNPNIEDIKAPIHEMGHVWTNWIQQKNPAIYKRGETLIKKTDRYKELLEENGGDKELATKETLAEMIANEGSEIVNASQKSKFKNWLGAMWKYIASQFESLRHLSPSKLKKVKIDEFIGGALNDIMRGQNLEDKKSSTPYDKTRFSLAPPTDSKAFKDWFGDSKVVNEDGSPKVVYHGSPSGEVSIFQNERKNWNTVGDPEGFYFTDNRDYAGNYSRDKETKQRGKVYHVYLKMENPLNITEALALNSRRPKSRRKPFSQEKRNIIERDFDPDVHDGIVFDGNNMNSAEYIVFSPTQIKSATDNAGTYDPSNADIRYSVAPPTDSMAFKDWFKDSKVVNEDGSPKVVYHGTNKEFTEFDPNKSSDGTLSFFFSDDIESAELITNEMMYENPVIMDAYLSMEKPFIVDFKGEDYNMFNGKFKNKWYQGIDDLAYMASREGNYDGIIAKNVMDSYLGTQYIAFSPTQIKSATDNVGTYDPSNADIRYSLTPQDGSTLLDKDPEEVFDFMGKRWDIDYAKEFAKQDVWDVEKVNVDDLAPLLSMISVDSDYASKTDNKDPMIAVETDQGLIPIDGWHRLRRAIDNGDKTIDVTILDKNIGESIEIDQYAGAKSKIRKETIRKDRIAKRDNGQDQTRYAMKPLANAEVLASTYIASKQAEGKPLTDAEIEDVMEAFDIENKKNVLENVSKIVDDEDDSIKKATHTSTMRKAIATKANKLAYQDRIRGIATDAKKGGAIYQQAEDRLRKQLKAKKLAELTGNKLSDEKTAEITESLRQVIDQGEDTKPVLKQIEDAVREEMISKGEFTKRKMAYKKDPAYRIALGNTLTEIANNLVRDLPHSRRKDSLSKIARNLKNYTSVKYMENNFDKFLDKRKKAMIVEDKKTLLKKWNKLMNSSAVKEKDKSTQEIIRSKFVKDEDGNIVAKSLHPKDRRRIQLIKQVAKLGTKAKKGDLSKLDTVISALKAYIDRASVESNEAKAELKAIELMIPAIKNFNHLDPQDRAQLALAEVVRFGGIREKSEIEIADALDAIEEDIASSFSLVEDLINDKNKRVNPKRDAIAETEGERSGKKRQKFDEYLGMAYDMRSWFDAIISKAPEGKRAEAKKHLDGLLRDWNHAIQTRDLEINKSHNEYFSAVEKIYNDEAWKITQRLEQKVDAYRKFSKLNDPMSKAQVMQLYASAVQQDYIDNAIENDRTAGQYLEVLTKEDLALIQWYRDYYADQRPSLSTKLEELTGIPINMQDPFYVPVKVKMPEGDLPTEIIITKIIPDGMIQRIQHTRDFDETVSINQMWMKKVAENEHFKNVSDIAMDFRSVFSSGRVHDAIANTYGTRFKNDFMEMIQDNINDGYSGDKKIDWLDKLRGSWTASKFGYNARIGIKQLTSIPAFGFEIGLVNVGKYTATAWTPEGRKAMLEILKSDLAKDRLGKGSTEAIMNSLNESLITTNKINLQKWTKRMMVFNELGDIVPSMLIGQGIYRSYTEHHSKTMDKAKAKETALKDLFQIIESTQQSSKLKDWSAFQRRYGSLGRMMSQFTNTTRQFLVRDFTDIRNYIDNRSSDNLKKMSSTLFINHALLPALYNGMNMIINKLMGDDIDEDDWWLMGLSMLTGPLSGYVVAGTILVGMTQGIVTGEKPWGGTSLTPFAGIKDDMISSGQIAHGILTADTEEFIRGLDDLLQSLVAPYREGKKIKKNYVD